MTIRLFSLSRLVAKFVHSPRTQLGLCTLGICAFVSLTAEQSHAQLIEGLAYPGNNGAIGSAAMGSEVRFSDHTVGAAGMADTNGVFVAPGSITSPLNVPSAIDVPQVPGRTRLVNQPFPSGPFVTNQPVYQDGGQAIPCPCDAGCDFEYYGSAEALYFRRDHDERFSLSQNINLPPFEYEWAGRVTVGRVVDCVNGYEAVYAGPLKWDRQSTLTGANLTSRLVPVGFLPAATTAFDNATTHTQLYQARMNTFEINRRWWAWDVFSTLIGIRAVDYRENYGFFSTGAGGTGIYEDQTRNRMIGPQIGGEFMSPLGLRTLVGVKGKAALLANFSRNELFLQNAGINVLGASDSDVDVAGMFELGTYAKYSITPSIRLMAGYEFWYLPNVATVPEQNLQIVSPGTGARVRFHDDLFMHGASAGAQILF